jgi:hypothetical protein
LKIRNEQIEAMAKGVRKEYERRVLDHIARYFPRQMRLFGRERLHPLAVRSIEQANAYRMVSEESVCVYADILMMLGADFDVDPQLPFAGAILLDPGLSERERAAKLYNAVKDYWQKVAGSDGGAWMDALRTFRKFPVESNRQPGDGEDIEVVSGLLRRLHPSKHTFLGDLGVRNFLRFSAGEARKLGIETGPGFGVLAALMFLGGSGFLHDPRFDWIGALLDETARRKENWLAHLHGQASKKFDEWVR